MEYFDIEQMQARKWLDRAVAEGSAEKVTGGNSYTSK
jgi:hypothetical protein